MPLEVLNLRLLGRELAWSVKDASMRSTIVDMCMLDDFIYSCLVEENEGEKGENGERRNKPHSPPEEISYRRLFYKKLLSQIGFCLAQARHIARVFS